MDRLKFEPFGERRHAWAVAHPLVDSLVLNVSTGFTGHVAVWDVGDDHFDSTALLDSFRWTLNPVTPRTE